VGLRAVMDIVVKRKIPSPRRESNPRTPRMEKLKKSGTTQIKITFTKNLIVD
jgi:hypothetical protein